MSQWKETYYVNKWVWETVENIYNGWDVLKISKMKETMLSYISETKNLWSHYGWDFMAIEKYQLWDDFEVLIDYDNFSKKEIEVIINKIDFCRIVSYRYVAENLLIDKLLEKCKEINSDLLFIDDFITNKNLLSIQLVDWYKIKTDIDSELLKELEELNNENINQILKYIKV